MLVVIVLLFNFNRLFLCISVGFSQPLALNKGVVGVGVLFLQSSIFVDRKSLVH